METSETLRERVRAAYSAIAEHPQADVPFPTGRELAEGVGYPSDLLDTLPATSVEAFCGVSNVSVFAGIPQGSTVLDLGCGAGMDMLLAARRTGETGKVIGIDFSAAMLERAARALAENHAQNVELRLADAEQLPLEDRSVDVALANGIFNLNPQRDLIFRELARVVKAGGAVYASELVLREPLPAEDRQGAANWFS